jgi:hypothetical protein
MKRLILNQPEQVGDRQLVAQYIGLMFMRTRGPRDNAASYVTELESSQFGIDLVERHRKLFYEEFGKSQVEQFYKNAKEKGTGLRMPKNFHLANLFQRVEEWGRKVFSMEWTIWEAPASTFFIISDNPAFARDPCKLKAPAILGIDRDDLNVELGFPLSSRAFLIAKWGKGPILLRESCRPLRVLALNTRTAVSAIDEVYSPARDAQIESLVREHKDYRVQYVQLTREDLLAMWPEIVQRRRRNNGSRPVGN